MKITFIYKRFWRGISVPLAEYLEWVSSEPAGGAKRSVPSRSSWESYGSCSDSPFSISHGQVSIILHPEFHPVLKNLPNNNVSQRILSMRCDHRNTTRNIQVSIDSKESWELHPAAAGEPAEGLKSSVFGNGLERPEDSFRIPRITRDGPNRYQTHTFQPSAGPAELAAAGEPAGG